MTITARNNLRLFFLFISFFISFFAIFAYVYSWVAHSYLLLPENIISFRASSFFSYHPIAVSTIILIFSLSSFTSSIYIFFAFRKIQSTEMFFLEVFLFSINWEALRLLVPFFAFSPTILAELSVISRLIYLFRFLGIFSLLGMSLFSIKVISRRVFFILFFLFFLSLMLSMSYPLDSTEINHLFMAGNTYIKTYLILFFSSSFFLIISVILSYIYNSVPERLHIIGAMISLLIGYFVLLYSYDYWLMCFGAFFFLYGALYSLKSIHSIYLWQ